MWDMLGLSLKKQAQGEINNLNDTRSELDNWSLGDRFRSALTGVSREDIQKKAKELLEKKINATLSKQRGDITTLAGGFDLGLGDKIRNNETYEDYETRLSGEKATATVANQYSLLKGSDTSLLKPGMKVGDIRAMSGNLRDYNEKTEKAEGKKETLRQEGIIADREEAGKTERANIRAEERAAQRADNKLTRDLGILTNDKDMAIAQMNADLADKRMDYDRETRRMDKRSAAIAQLMSGLGSLGGAFSL